MSDATLFGRAVIDRLTALEVSLFGGVANYSDITNFERAVLARIGALEVQKFGSVTVEPDITSFTRAVLDRLTALEGAGGGGLTYDSTLPAPVLTLNNAYNAYPPDVSYSIPGGADSTWSVEMMKAATESSLAALTSGVLQPVTASPANFGLSAIGSPAVTIMRMRVNTGTSYGPFSNDLVHGTTVPTITSSLSLTAVENQAVLGTLVTDRVSILTLGGTDGAALSATTSDGLTHTIHKATGNFAYDSTKAGFKRSFSFTAQPVSNPAGIPGTAYAITGTITNDTSDDPAATVLLNTTTGANKSSRVAVSAGNLYWTADSTLSASGGVVGVRADHPAQTTKFHVEAIYDGAAASGAHFNVGLDDGTPDFSTVLAESGLGGITAKGISFEPWAVGNNGCDLQVDGVKSGITLAQNWAVGDGIFLEGDQGTGQIKAYHWHNPGGGYVATLVETVTPTTSALTAGNWNFFVGGSAGDANGDKGHVNFNGTSAAFLMTPTAGFSGYGA